MSKEVEQKTEHAKDQATEQVNNTAVKKQPEEKRKKVRLHRRYTVLDANHAEIGYVKNRVFYSLTDKEYGKFFKNKGEVSLRRLPRKAKDHKDSSYTKLLGYLRENEEVYTPRGKRLLILVRKNYFVPIVIILIILSLLASMLCMKQVIVSKDYIPTLFITEKDNTSWSDLEEITVFENGRFGDKIIYPGIEGEYKFRLINTNPDTLIYSINFSEKNDYNVNMLYRLKRNDTYLGDGTYKSIFYLHFEDLEVETRCNDIFTLEWKWEDADNDTEVGMSNATYVLNVRVDAHV